MKHNSRQLIAGVIGGLIGGIIGSILTRLALERIMSLYKTPWLLIMDQGSRYVVMEKQENENLEQNLIVGDKPITLEISYSAHVAKAMMHKLRDKKGDYLGEIYLGLTDLFFNNVLAFSLIGTDSETYNVIFYLHRPTFEKVTPHPNDKILYAEDGNQTTIENERILVEVTVIESQASFPRPSNLEWLKIRVDLALKS